MSIFRSFNPHFHPNLYFIVYICKDELGHVRRESSYLVDLARCKVLGLLV